MKKTRQKPKCSKGYGCGNSCINSKLICRGTVPDEFMEQFAAAVKAAQTKSAATPTVEPDTDKKTASDLSATSAADLAKRTADWVKDSFGSGGFDPGPHDLEHIAFHNIAGIDSKYIMDKVGITTNNFMFEEILVGLTSGYMGRPEQPAERKSSVDAEALKAAYKASDLMAMADSPDYASVFGVTKPDQIRPLLDEISTRMAAADVNSFYMVPEDSAEASAKRTALADEFDKYKTKK